MGGFEPHRGTALFATAALGIVLVGSALAVGTVHLSVLLPVSTGAILACSVVAYRERAHIRRLPAPAVALLALAGWSAIQAIPVPMLLLILVAPHNADVWARCLRPFGELPPRFAS